MKTSILLGCIVAGTTTAFAPACRGKMAAFYRIPVQNLYREPNDEDSDRPFGTALKNVTEVSPSTTPPTTTHTSEQSESVQSESSLPNQTEGEVDKEKEWQSQQKIKLPSLKKKLLFDPVQGRFYEHNDDEPIPLATIFERTLDTVEDAVLHARRIPYDKGWIEHKPEGDGKIPTIVVLGSGWAAHALMKVADTYKMRLIVVSPTNHFVFTPMLASAAVGTVEYRSMTEAVRSANPMIENYIEGRAIDIDVEKQLVNIQLESLMEDVRSGSPPAEKLYYDKLVVSVGCKVNDSIVPGAAKYCYRLKSCEDARKLRAAIGECLEYGSRPCVAPEKNLAGLEVELRREARRKRLTFCIVGGGPTGVELAGELTDFIKDITRDRVGSYHKIKDDIRIVLVQGASDLVPQFEQELRDHALRTLQKEGVDVRLDTYVNEVGNGWIKLQPKNGGPEEKLDVGLTVWAAGVGPVPFMQKLLEKLPEEAKGANGRIKVDKWLRCSTPTPETFGSILVLGDAAAFEDEKGSLLPQTAQVAGQQGAYVARMLDRGYDLSLTPPTLPPSEDDNLSTWMKLRGLQEAPGFKFLNLGILAYLGQGQALSQVQLGDVPIFSYAGSISFVLWRSVYLVKQVATRNRVLVLFDWIKCRIFGRDITRL